MTKHVALEQIRAWNANVPPGTEVEWHGQKFRTWGPAGMGYRGVPSVWLEGVEELVPLAALEWEGK